MLGVDMEARVRHQTGIRHIPECSLREVIRRARSEATPIHTRRLTWDPIDVTVSSPDRWMVSEAERLYRTYLDATYAHGHTGYLYCERNPGLVRALESVLKDADQISIPAEGPHSGRIRLSRLVAGVGRREVLGILMDVDDYFVLLVPSRGEGVAALILRQVRIHASRQLYEAGWTPIHTAVVVPPGKRAILFVGSKCAGKTTAMLYCLARCRASFVANDKAFLSPSGPLRVRSLPTAVGVRRDTVKLFPQLQALLPRASLFHVDNHELLRKRWEVCASSVEARDRLFVPPDTLTSAFRVPWVRDAEVGSVVFLCHDPLASPAVSVLSRERMGALLEEQRLDRDRNWCLRWLREDTSPSLLVKTKLSRLHLSGISLLRVTRGLACNGGLDDVMAEVLGAAS